MSNDKDFKVKNGIQPTVYHEGLGTVVSGSLGYQFSSAYDTGNTLDISSVVGTSPTSLRWKPDGLKLFVLSAGVDTIYSFTLTSPYDLSTVSAPTTYTFFQTEASNPITFHISSDGTKLYVPAYTSASEVHQYTLSTPWDLSSESYDGFLDLTGVVVYGCGAVGFKSDGTKVYVYDNFSLSNVIYQYDLSVAWDVTSTTSNQKTLSVLSVMTGTSGSDITFSPDGLSFLLAKINTSDGIYKYDMSTAWDISTGTLDTFFDTLSIDGTPRSPNYNADGTSLFFVGQANRNIHELSTVLNTAELDLSTGSVFEVTPTSDVQVTLSNPADSGTVSGATLLLEGAESTGVASTFSTTLYTGNSGTQTITNGIDLAGDGGMVWGKVRSISDNHWIVDSENGIGSNGTYNYLQTNLITGLSNFGDRSVSSFNSDGFTLANSTNDQFNLSPQTYVSWTFKKQSSFFDVVTYTGDGVAGRSISHSLNSDVGTILFKRTDSTSNWIVWHRSAGGAYGFLDATDAFTADSGISNPTTTAFTIESTINAGWNASGATYVAYLFAHDTDASSLIKCGSYTGNGSSGGNSVSIGWEPQFVIIKNTSAAADWVMFDTKRGVVTGGSAADDKYLFPNGNNSEGGGIPIDFTSTGFEVFDTSARTNASGNSFIYIAIRAENIPTITYDPTLEWPGGTAPTAPANGETDVVTFNTRDGGSTYQGVLAIDGAK